MRDFRRKKIGLVLTGGGAKGAYHVGCWKALRRAGIVKFSAIAGTSVGAMNAVLISGDELDRAVSTWSELRWSDIVTFDPARFFLVPVWGLAYLASEFSPLRLTAAAWRAIVAVISILSIGGAVHAIKELFPNGGAMAFAAVAVTSMASGSLSRVRNLTRRAVMISVGVSTAPLARRLSKIITDDQMRLMRRSGTRIYGTLSCLRSRKNHEPQWVPRYLRLDKMKRDTLIETLVSGAGVPGLSDLTASGDPVVDGGWTDNMPIAPIIFDTKNPTDILIIINTGLKSVGTSDGSVSRESLARWAEKRWHLLHPHARPVTPHLPEIIWVTPSESLGGFYTGTCRFSRRQAKKLMALGEKDMAETLRKL